ncbi:MAG TPA: DinB family protein [Terriglobales bacterium]|nr:DinB family protein [Terriglobales bacterium]
MKITESVPENLTPTVCMNDLLLQELDEEIAKTRTALQRVPVDKKDFAPHSKSMPLGKLAPHVAQLAEFGVIVLTTPGLDFGTGSFVPLQFESGEQLAQVFDESMRKVRDSLCAVPAHAWTESWQLSLQGQTIFKGSRFLAYRSMFLNHLIHHRAQLGVYLRLTGKQVPSTYGPSADEGM